MNPRVGSQEDEILAPFPVPPGSALRALKLLRVLGRGDRREMARYEDLNNLPRPWDPSTCIPELRSSVWAWCDHVADWINHEYAWRPTQTIPSCWLHHPHIARELPVLAFQRWAAEKSTSYEAIDGWHRIALPTFLDRMHARLGESTCGTGKHLDWPAANRIIAYNAVGAVKERKTIIQRDSHPLLAKPHDQRRG